MTRPPDTTSPERLTGEADFDRALRPGTFAGFLGPGEDRPEPQGLHRGRAAARRAAGPCAPDGPAGTGQDHARAHHRERNGRRTLKATSGPVLDKPGDLAGLLTNLREGDVLFIDEIHRLNPVVEEYLYAAMEDFRLDIMIDSGPNARSIQLALPKLHAHRRDDPRRTPHRPPCARASASATGSTTTMPGRSARSSSAPSKLLQVAVQPEGVEEIARRSRGTPRIANRLLRRCRDFAQADRAMARHKGVITREVADHCAASPRGGRARPRRHGQAHPALRSSRSTPADRSGINTLASRGGRGTGHHRRGLRALPDPGRIPEAHPARPRSDPARLRAPPPASARAGCSVLVHAR